MNIKKSVMTFVAIVLAIITTYTLAPFAYAAEELTPSEISYLQLEGKINEFINERRSGTASVSVAVFDGSETICDVCYGYSDIENKIPADENTVYEWGSCSKLLVWISVMQQYERGEIDLNADIRNYLPDGFLTKLNFMEPVTIIDLMNHRGGWQDTSYAVEFDDANRLTSLAEALKSTEPSQVYEPDTVTAYSNWSTTLAAYIVERTSGIDYAEYVHKNIFAPLGMEHTSVRGDFTDNNWVKSQREKVKTYSIYEDSFESFGTNMNYINLYPAGAATGTLDDFLKFAKSFAPGSEETSLLFSKRDTLDKMLSPTSAYSGTDIARNCHGLWTMEYAVSVVGHGGNTIGFSTMLMFEPKSGLGVVIMTNEANETAYNYGLLTLLFGHCESNSIDDIHDISGLYLAKRTIEKGFLRFFKYSSSIMPVTRTEIEGEYSIAGMSAKQISNSLYLCEYGNGMEYVFNVTKNSDGKLIIENYTCDYERADTFSLVCVWILILLTLIAGIYSLIRAIICLIGLIRRNQTGTAAVMRLATTAGGTVSVALMLYLWLECNNALYPSVVPLCVAVAVLSILPIVNAVVLIIKRKEIVKPARFIIPGIICFIPTISTIFFQTYNFWSC